MAIDAASSAGWAFSVRSSRSAGPSQAQLAERLAEGGIGRRPDGGGGGRGRGEIPAHAHGLRALAGEHEGEGGHRAEAYGAGLPRLGIRVHACMHDGYPPRSTRRRPAPRAPSRSGSRPTCPRRSSPPARGCRNVRQISERVAMGRALWRELVIGFASQLGELRLGFTQLAALYVLADGSTLTIGELAESINRSPSATSRLIDGLVKRRLVERQAEEEDRRQKIAAPDAARARRPARRGSGAGRAVPVGGPAAAHRRARDRRDGRRRARDPCHQPARTPDPGDGANRGRDAPDRGVGYGRGGALDVPVRPVGGTRCSTSSTSTPMARGARLEPESASAPRPGGPRPRAGLGARARSTSAGRAASRCASRSGSDGRRRRPGRTGA